MTYWITAGFGFSVGTFLFGLIVGVPLMILWAVLLRDALS